MANVCKSIVPLCRSNGFIVSYLFPTDSIFSSKAKNFNGQWTYYVFDISNPSFCSHANECRWNMNDWQRSLNCYYYSLLFVCFGLVSGSKCLLFTAIKYIMSISSWNKNEIFIDKINISENICSTFVKSIVQNSWILTNSLLRNAMYLHLVIFIIIIIISIMFTCQNM